MSTSGLESYPARHRAAVTARGRLCIGIDPHAQLLQQWGLGVSADGLARFADICVEALAPVAAVIKPQVAFFEQFGSAGFAVLERVIAGCRDGGAMVVADAKRGDIGSTMAAYATAWLDDSSALCSDAVTASPYLGFGSLLPALDLADQHDRGVIVLARTSNPEGEALQNAVQEAQDADGAVSVAQSIVDQAAARNAAGGGVGVVVGATRAHGLDLAGLGGVILAPGLGAQGATAADLPEIFDTAPHEWLLPATSRGVLRHGPTIADLRGAAQTARDEIESVLH